ncbi:hypothetical protein [Nocardia terpenica]|uniref:Uncharacterized protein n=1 Tax=Nocardia terpenica TaxID=455432 RepID=A0A291RQZ0_9NOCA|nr:hypothetical protein [Nocardia terpenica]ATL69893.1 hypothetical protein CRH09_30690 [Nocardia terpenica]
MIHPVSVRCGHCQGLRASARAEYSGKEQIMFEPHRTRDPNPTSKCGRAPISGDVVMLPPLCYGYVRTDLIADDAVEACDAALARIASVEYHHQLAGVFHESPQQSCQLPPELVRLVAECGRAEAHMVLTFTGHLSGMGVARICVLDYIASRGHAHVVEVTDAH